MGRTAIAIALHWTWSRLEGLGALGVYDMLALRARIFILEQGPYLDADGKDKQSWHLLGRDDAGELRAYLRVVDPRLSFAEPSMGRVVLDKALRGSGLADQLVAEGLRRASAAWPGQGNRISAQAHLQRFYGRHGFVVAGEVHIEDTIPHIHMWRAP